MSLEKNELFKSNIAVLKVFLIQAMLSNIQLIHLWRFAGSVSTFSSDKGFSSFTPRTIFDNNSFNTGGYMNWNAYEYKAFFIIIDFIATVQSDAVPFSYGSQRKTAIPYRSPYNSTPYSSYPMRSNPSTVVSRPPITTSTFTPINFSRPTTTATTTSVAAPAVTRSTSVVPTYEHTSRKLGRDSSLSKTTCL